MNAPDPTPTSTARRKRVPAWLPLVLRLAVVAGLLAWIATRMDARELATTLARADPRYLGFAALAVILGQFTAGWRWYRLLVAAGSTWSFGRSFAVYCAGLFLGLFIPTGVGGDVYRVARVRTSGAGLGRGTATIVLERAIGLLALLILGTGFVLSQPGTRPWGLLFLVGSLVGLAGLAALWIPGGPEHVARVLDRFPGRGLGNRVRNAFPQDAMTRLHGAIPGTVALSLANHGWILTANVMLALGLRLPVSWHAVCAAVPLVLLAAQVPITPGGTGLREAAYVFFLGRVGVPQTQALALALGWFALLVGTGLLAALGLLFDRESGRERGPGVETRTGGTEVPPAR